MTFLTIKHSILFNSKKSHIIIFHKKCTNENLYLSLNGEKLVVVNKTKHLGHILTNASVGFVDFGHTRFPFKGELTKKFLFLFSLDQVSLISLLKYFHPKMSLT